MLSGSSGGRDPAGGGADERRYPPKAILGTAYEFSAGEGLGPGDFEGGKDGAVAVLGRLGLRRTAQAMSLAYRVVAAGGGSNSTGSRAG